MSKNNMKVKSIKFHAYKIIERAVEEGVRHGMQRAYKYSDNPNEEQIIVELDRAIMFELNEVIDFESEEFAD